MNFDDILAGSSPSTVFRRYLEQSPSLTKTQLALKFTDAFPKVGGVSHQIVWNWNWKQSTVRIGMSDEVFDEEIRQCLKNAKYI